MRGCLTAAWLLLAFTAASAAEPAKKVLFLGIDGCRFDALEAANTPHLDSLISAGTLAVGTHILAARETPGDTVSGPGWSNLLCGVWPDKHGVVDNSFRGSNYKEYPHFFARLKEVRPAAKTASFDTWGPILKNIVSGADVGRHFPEGKENCTLGDREATTACVAYLKEQNPDVVMLYLGDVDETGHRKGFHPKVPEYVRAIEIVDGYIGEVLAAIQARPHVQEEDWLVLVGTDHGGIGLGHGGGRTTPEVNRTFLIVSGPSAVRQRTEEPTYQVDLVATAFAHLGVQPKPEWKLDGRPVGLKPAR